MLALIQFLWRFRNHFAANAKKLTVRLAVALLIGKAAGRSDDRSLNLGGAPSIGRRSRADHRVIHWSLRRLTRKSPCRHPKQ